MTAPGVKVTNAVRTGPTPVLRAVSGQYFTTGITERGPVDKPVKVNSMADYKKTFGDRVAYGTVYDDLAMFFETGGTQAWVLRAVGSSATIGTRSLMDGAATPLATIKVDAVSPGSWSTRIKVAVAAGSTSGRKVTILFDDVQVQSYDNLATVADIVAKFDGSPYVKVTDLGSATAAPTNLPAIAAAAALSAGADDRAAVNGARIVALLPLLKVGYGDGAVAAPGFGSSVHAGLIAHAEANRRIAILSMARGTSRDDLITAATGLATEAGRSAGLFAPWVQVADGAGGTRTISPEGYVAGARAKAHDEAGPWQSAAGETSVSPFILGLDQEFTLADHELMDVGNVNPIRLVANKNRLYGWQSLSADEENYGALTVQDTANRITTECELRLEPFVHKTVDSGGKTFAAMKGILIGVLEPLRMLGGLYEAKDTDGNVTDPGYSVSLSATDAQLAASNVFANVAFRPSPNAKVINLTITKVGLTAAV